MAEKISKTVKETIRRMTELGTYKPEFHDIILIYAGLLDQYQTGLIAWQTIGQGKIEVEAANGATKKSPYLTMLETLRKDIVVYSDRLGLNPKAMRLMGAEVQPTEVSVTSRIDDILNEL